ncbi:MAG TPA: hypothetical protein VFH89_12325 [Sphingomicrobium sp.]|nr:hypothetical protein [Sphingomicrobium sp.]
MKIVSSALVGALLTFAFMGPAFGEPSSTKSVQLSKVVVDTESNELVARVKGGTLCVFPSDVKVPKEKKTQDYERFDNLFTQQLKLTGLKVVSTSNDMFEGEDESKKGDYLVGVIMRPTTYNLCSSVNGEKGKIAVNAEWKIYDRAAGKVVETVMTSGEGVQDKFAIDGEKQMLNSAFRSNVDALLAKGLLQKYAQLAAAQ